MRLLFIADGRSPIALNWIDYFIQRGDEVHLASTYPCQPKLELASLHAVPVAFSAVKVSEEPQRRVKRKPLARLVTELPNVGLRTRLRQWLGPLTLRKSAQQLEEIIEQVQPDLLHAMRIPYEGMMAALVDSPVPLLISVWGNDFTLHAPTTPLMRRYTRHAMRRADALHSDTQRDIGLAEKWGFDLSRPHTVLPGGGGVQPELFYPPTKGAKPVRPTIINPRGLRAYVRNDTFFKAIPQVLKVHRDALFLCPTMQGEARAEHWVRDLDIAAAIELLPHQTRPQMADLFRNSKIAVSPSTHDGTPNTLLEAMASGCFPIAGDIESLREWITPGVNGLLIDPGDPDALAQAILDVMDDPDLRHDARQHNARLIAERATYEKVMKEAGEFYQKIVG